MSDKTHSTNIKLGRLISRARRQRGLTQAQVAKLLETSQSAINRIENGKQNLSLETIARLGKALGTTFLSFNPASALRIHGGRELKGEITIKPSKNATLGLMFASLLNQGKTILQNAAKVEEVFRIIELFESIGVNIRWKEGNLEIQPPDRLNLRNINQLATEVTRSSVMLIGPVAVKYRKFVIPFSGGCRLGKRSISTHVQALSELGIQIKTVRDCHRVSSQPIAAKRAIVMYESSDTATINALFGSLLPAVNDNY